MKLNELFVRMHYSSLLYHYCHLNYKSRYKDTMPCEPQSLDFSSCRRKQTGLLTAFILPQSSAADRKSKLYQNIVQNSIVKLHDIHFILLFLSERSFVRIADLINKLTKKMKETSTDNKDAVCSHSPTES